MRFTIVGLPFTGKTTLFSALSGIPAAHIRPGSENLAAVKVPEPRLDFLEEMYKPKKRTESTIEFVDLPGGGDEDKAGLEKHIPTLRQSDGLLICVRAFESAAVATAPGGVNPQRELQRLHEELVLADLLICSGRIEKLEAAIKKPSPQRDQQKRELLVLERCRAALEQEQPLAGVVQAGEEEKMLRSFGFLTQKPLVVAVNVGEEAAAAAPPFQAPHGAPTFALCATLEAELVQVEPADRSELMSGYGLQELHGPRIVRGCFDALGMIFFLTAGEPEVRAWPIPRDTTAVDAAGKIHTDIARGFIKAETIAYADLLAAGSMRDARAANKVRQEPKTYVVQDGDIMNFKFNV